MIGLKIDPVGYSPCVARFASGASFSRETNALYWRSVIGRVKISGSKVGAEPIARISPVSTLIAT